jgi:hypothetical protein
VSTVTLTSGQLAPDGTLGATKISGTLGLSSIYLPSSTSTTATRSIYARTVSGTGTAKLMSHNSNTNNLFTLTEEWQRFELTTSNSSGGTNFYVDFRDTSQTLNEFIIWGAQSEELSYATSYIPTLGSSVTRNADACSLTNVADRIGQTEGVVYMDFVAQRTDGVSQSHFWLGASGSEIGLYGGSQFIFYSSGGVQINGGNIVNGQRYKVAFGYKANDYVAYINGTQVGTDTSATVPTMSALVLNSYFDGTELQKKDINDFKLYNTKLSNSELAALTTI